jgi:1,4-alpha-glucan branching enzyme
MDKLNEESANSVMAGGPASNSIPNDGTGVIQLDPWLGPYKDALKHRYSKAQDWIAKIEKTEGGLEKFSRGIEKFGLNVDKDNNVIYREWAPNATHAFLIGDFNDWNRDSHPMKKDDYGVWEIVVPAKNGQPAIAHNSKLKVSDRATVLTYTVADVPT